VALKTSGLLQAGSSRTKIVLTTSVLWEIEEFQIDIRVNYLWLCEYHWIANFEEKNGVNILGIAGMIS
jgi:hypothetical protein